MYIKKAHTRKYGLYVFGRGREIRTPDILLPKQARYQTALYPVNSLAVASILRRASGGVLSLFSDCRQLPITTFPLRGRSQLAMRPVDHTSSQAIPKGHKGERRRAWWFHVQVVQRGMSACVINPKGHPRFAPFIVAHCLCGITTSRSSRLVWQKLWVAGHMAN